MDRHLQKYLCALCSVMCVYEVKLALWKQSHYDHLSLTFLQITRKGNVFFLSCHRHNNYLQQTKFKKIIVIFMSYLSQFCHPIFSPKYNGKDIMSRARICLINSAIFSVHSEITISMLFNNQTLSFLEERVERKKDILTSF